MMGTTENRGAAETAPGTTERHWRSHSMSTIRIPLGSRKYPGLFAEIDEDDYSLVSSFRWKPCRAPHTFYAHTSNNKSIPMHRVILGLKRGDPDVDHIDRDGLNNVRGNLRLCSNSLNQANRRQQTINTSSRYRGVTWHKQARKWQAQIEINKRKSYLGVFDSEEDAAHAYDCAALDAFGEFSHTNFPIQPDSARKDQTR